ncbi:LD-carboxypeptidase [Amycolatopsis antarctica]|uniref:LD-carboxypeptidase n=1 Tax=Amycolatopsis antarctica TaxID=1854586 RepID=A0A263D3T1_9PSEU|nr:LD-carboxypeptidase [Amycolatopsis antarctica]
MRQDDTVALVAPAGPVAAHLLDSALDALAAWKVSVRVYDSVRSRHPIFPYLAAADDARAADFRDAWLDPDVDAVFAARGGYGCMRILDLLDWGELRSAGPKLFAGSSDVTALHEAIAVHLGLSTVFSPMPASAHFDEIAAARLHGLLTGEGPLTITGGQGALVGGRARGVTVGGNLSLLAAGLGAAEHHRPVSGIALLEDVGEDIYRLDRILTQLLRSGWFDGVTGIALGSWADCGTPDDVRALMRDRLGSLGVPIAWEFGFGHIPASLSLPFGAEVELDADAGTITLTRPALES